MKRLRGCVGCVLRGGSWDYSSITCRPARRSRDYPEKHYGNNGFRVVCAPRTSKMKGKGP